jgi:hypothetical protein
MNCIFSLSYRKSATPKLIQFTSREDVSHCLGKLFPVYQFFLAVAILLGNFGVRLYVSIVVGGSTTTSILAKAVDRRTGFLPIFQMNISHLCSQGANL